MQGELKVFLDVEKCLLYDVHEKYIFMEGSKMAEKKTANAKTAVKAEKKTTAAKPRTKRAVKKEPKKKFCVQWMGNSFSQEEIEKKVKKAWTKEFKGKIGDLKEIQIYVKVEENAAYYVINGTDSGRADLLSE